MIRSCMADNYLERKRRDYEKRKAEWLQKKGYHSRLSSNIEKPEDEAL